MARMSESSKHFVSAAELLRDSLLLADAVVNSGYAPTLVVGVWRGGAPIAVSLHEYLQYRGVPAEHGCLTARSYAGIDQQANRVQLEGLEPLVSRLTAHTRLLLVDDIFDTGRTFDAIINALRDTCPLAALSIKTASVWYKPTRNVTQRQPDYFVHSTDQWVVFPHELVGLTPAEIAQHKRLPSAEPS